MSTIVVSPTLHRAPATAGLVALALSVTPLAQPLTEYGGLDLISSATPVLFTTFADEMTATAWATFPGLVQQREPALAVGAVPPAYTLDDIYATIEGTDRSWLPSLWIGKSNVSSDGRVTSNTTGGWQRFEKSRAYYNAGLWKWFGDSRRTAVSVFIGQSRDRLTESSYAPGRSIEQATSTERYFNASDLTVTSGVSLGRNRLLRISVGLLDATEGTVYESGSHPDSMVNGYGYPSQRDARGLRVSAGLAPWHTDRLLAFVNVGATMTGTDDWSREARRLDASPYLELAAARAWRGRHVALWGGVSIAAQATLFGALAPRSEPLSDRLRALCWDDSDREFTARVPLTLRITPAQRWCVAFNWEPSLTWQSTKRTHTLPDSSWAVHTSLTQLGALVEYTPVPWIRIAFSPQLNSSNLVAGLEGRILLGAAADARRKAAERKKKRGQQ